MQCFVLFRMTNPGEPQPCYRQYPLPLATYDEVVRNPKLFMETLEELHASMETKFMIPIIGGRELDLHRLFVEVTSRGGIDKIIKDRKWKDVAAVFSFPSSATNASFVSRKYYISLMHHYEQIYFFGARVWIPPPAASLPAPSSAPASMQGVKYPTTPDSETHSVCHKRRRSTEEFLPNGYPVVGVIDGQFEHGCSVTVTVGTQKLRGVLFHINEIPPVASVAQFPSGAHNSTNNVIGAPGITRQRRRRKKSEIRKRDPSHPKPNRSGYNFFFAEQHARLKPLHPRKDREIIRMIGELWNNLTETEKAVYQERGVKDKERYRSEMEEYRERLKADSIVAVPIQQRLVIPMASSAVNYRAKMEVDQVTEHESTSEEEESEYGEDDMDEKISDAEVFQDAEGSPACNVAVAGGFELRRRGNGGKVTDVKDLFAEQSKSNSTDVGLTEAVKDLTGDVGTGESSLKDKMA